MLDTGVSHLLNCFPRKRVVSVATLGLPANLPDDQIVEEASTRSYTLVASNRRDFIRDVEKYVAQSSRKPNGCCRVPGMILLVPNGEIAQRRVLVGLESRLIFEGKRIRFGDVHDRDLLVTVEETGKAKVTRLPRCPHCKYRD